METPAGVAKLRGTQMGVEYFANYQGTGTPLLRVICPGGGCSVDNPFGGVELPPGQKTEVLGSSGPGAPGPMDLADWTNWN